MSVWLLGLVLGSSLVADGVAWEKDYKQAFARAAELKVPVLVCLNMDHEWANDELANKIYQDPKFTAEASKLVCLIGSAFEHEKTADGHCARFKTITCAEHKQIEIEARKQFVGSSVAIAPQHILATAKGEVIARKAYFLTLDELLKMIAESQAAATGTAADIKKRVDANTEKQMNDLRERAKTRDWEKQWQILSEADKIGERAAQMVFTEIACDKKCAMEMRRMAIQRLGKKGNYDTLDTLLKLLKEQETDLVIAAASALEVSELPPATEPMLKLIKHKPQDALRGTLLRALGACGGDDPDVHTLLIQGTRDSNPAVRCSSALGLGYVLEGKTQLSKPEHEALDTLLRVLNDTQWSVRGAAVYALGYARIAECKPQLEKVEKEDNAVEVRKCAQAAIKNLTATGPTDNDLTMYRWRFSGEILR
jgi:HEAT repeat protein